MAGRKKYSPSKKSGIGAISEESIMTAAEFGGGALGGSIGTLEIIRMVPSTTLNSNIRDGLAAAVGIGLLLLPEDMGGGALVKGIGCGMVGVAGMNIYMREFSGPAIGNRGYKGRRRIAGGPTSQNSSVIGRTVIPGSRGPVIGVNNKPLQDMALKILQAQA